MNMQYRTLPHGGEKISVIGMGSSVVGEQAEEKIIETVTCALDHGVNYFDMAGGHASIFPAYGKALQGRRQDALLQVHFGAEYTSGAYGWTTDLEKIKRSVAWQMENLRIDSIDFGFIHCLDEENDLRNYEKSGALQYVLSMKEQGVVKHIGLSTHVPAMACKVLDMGILDMLMFSLNPMYDYGQGEFANGSREERYALYRRCEKEGVGISVMKPLNGGQLLDAKKSPFHQAMTAAQCIQYALDKPGVMTVLPGVGSAEELMGILSYLDASEAQRDYAAVSALAPDAEKGACVYCRHCHPCPAGLDIGLINKYYDLSQLGDPLARQHYLTLEKKAGACVQCGHCVKRCPFHVDQAARMLEIADYFGC